MSKKNQKPGSHPARKGKQTQPSHSCDSSDKTVAGGSKSKVSREVPGGKGRGAVVKNGGGRTGGERDEDWFDYFPPQGDGDGPGYKKWLDHHSKKWRDVVLGESSAESESGDETPPPEERARCSRDLTPPPRETNQGGKSKGIDSKRTPPPGQARADSKKFIEQEVENYHRTEWYSKAVRAGFKTAGALKRFNETVVAFQNQIDPLQVPVCMECGNSDVELCEHFVVAAKVAVDVEEDALVIVPAVNMKHRFQWVNKFRRMFTWPSFDSTLVQNHNLAGFDNEQITDAYIWPELFSYIRLGFNTTYVIQGVHDRAAKLAHAKKLGVRFLDETKVGLADRNRPEFVNRFVHTVQRACDQRDDEMLLKETNPNQNFWVAPSTLLKVAGMSAVCGMIYFSPVITARLHVALLRPIHSFCGRLATESVVSLLLGSAQALRYAMRTVWETSSAIRLLMWSGSVKHSSTVIQQSLCKTAPIMSTRAFTSGISNLLPIFPGNLLIGDDWRRSYMIFQIGLLAPSTRLMGRVLC